LEEYQAAYEELARVIIEAWEAIDQDYIDDPIRSMERRVAAVVRAKEWHTKY
jgi:hypothetical protein